MPIVHYSVAAPANRKMNIAVLYNFTFSVTHLFEPCYLLFRGFFALKSRKWTIKINLFFHKFLRSKRPFQLYFQSAKSKKFPGGFAPLTPHQRAPPPGPLAGKRATAPQWPPPRLRRIGVSRFGLLLSWLFGKHRPCTTNLSQKIIERSCDSRREDFSLKWTQAIWSIKCFDRCNLIHLRSWTSFFPLSPIRY